METFRFVRVRKCARPPVKMSIGAAGYDLYAAENVFLRPGERACVGTGLQLGIPEGCYGRIAPRSGLSLKNGIHIGAGVVDRDFTGEVMVLLFNFGDAPFHVEIGERVAQIILEKIFEAGDAVEVPHLEVTKRDVHGFGSSGKN